MKNVIGIIIIFNICEMTILTYALKTVFIPLGYSVSS